MAKGITGFGITHLRNILVECGVATTVSRDKLVVEDITCKCCGHTKTVRDVKPIDVRYHIYNDGLVNGRSFKLDRKQLTQDEVAKVLAKLGTLFNHVEISFVPWSTHRPGHTGVSTRILVRNPIAEAQHV